MFRWEQLHVCIKYKPEQKSCSSPLLTFTRARSPHWVFVSGKEVVLSQETAEFILHMYKVVQTKYIPINIKY